MNHPSLGFLLVRRLLLLLFRLLPTGIGVVCLHRFGESTSFLAEIFLLFDSLCSEHPERITERGGSRNSPPEPRWKPTHSRLIVQENAQEAIIDGQFRLAIVINKTEFLEPIHEKIDPRPGCTDHFGQVLLSDAGNNSFGSTFPAKMRQR